MRLFIIIVYYKHKSLRKFCNALVYFQLLVTECLTQAFQKLKKTAFENEYLVFALFNARSYSAQNSLTNAKLIYDLCISIFAFIIIYYHLFSLNCVKTIIFLL